MTIAEIFLFFITLAGLYALLRPLQRWLESFLARLFTRRWGETIIDVDVQKADRPSKKE